MVRCNDPACSTTTTIVNAAIMPVSFFESHRLRVSYDGTDFSFRWTEAVSLWSPLPT